jgi:hypothetical protein
MNWLFAGIALFMLVDGIFMARGAPSIMDRTVIAGLPANYGRWLGVGLYFAFTLALLGFAADLWRL